MEHGLTCGDDPIRPNPPASDEKGDTAAGTSIAPEESTNIRRWAAGSATGGHSSTSYLAV